MKRLAQLIATVLGVGYVRPAPGTWGSLVALPGGYLLHLWGGFALLAAATCAVCLLGWWATAEITRDGDDHDPSEIVIDEVAGQWVALWALSWPASQHDIHILALWPGWIAAFFLFRFFDITKLGPVGWADRRGDPLGVMADDVFAGLFAAIGVAALAGVYHGVLGL